MRKVTKEEIEARKTLRGGWTRATLAEWGVPWPPPKGWRRELELNGEFKSAVKQAEFMPDAQSTLFMML